MNSYLLCMSLVLGPTIGQEPSAAPAPVPSIPEDMPTPRSLPTFPSEPPVLTPMTICDFARGFEPAPGKYEVLFIHPVKGFPVLVCFSLPPGCPRVNVGKREVSFDYGCRSVTIQFKILFGRVKVVYG